MAGILPDDGVRGCILASTLPRLRRQATEESSKVVIVLLLFVQNLLENTCPPVVFRFKHLSVRGEGGKGGGGGEANF